MVNVEEIKNIMDKKNVSNDALSKELNIDPTTLYRRFKKNGANFSIEEAQIIKEVLKLTNKQAINIFFKT